MNDFDSKSEFPPPPVEKSWEKQVREQYRDRCAGCGSADKLKPRLIVPEEAGGRQTVANGVLLCRSCEMASESVDRSSTSDQRLVNFWVSHRLFERIKWSIDHYQAFTSMGGLVRYLMSKYVSDPSRFDEDLMLYQDEGCDTKVNVWVPRDTYATFKSLVDTRGLTVTDSLKSLIVLYSETALENISPRTKGGDAE